MGIRHLQKNQITQENLADCIGHQIRFYYHRDGRDDGATQRIGLINEVTPDSVLVEFNNNPLSADKTGFKRFKFDKIASTGASIVLQK